MLEINHGGGKSRKTPAVRVEVEEVTVVLGLLRLVLGVEEEEGFVAVLLHRSAWRRGVHGVGATELVPVVASGASPLNPHTLKSEPPLFLAHSPPPLHQF